MASLKKPPVYLVTLAQTTVLLPLCLLAWAFDRTAAYSALLGGLVCLIPNAYFAIYAFRYMGARSAGRIARAFFWGETGKFLLTFVGFGLIYLLVHPLNVLVLMATYIILVVVQWVASAKLIG